MRHRQTSTRTYDATTQKPVIFRLTAAKTSNHTSPPLTLNFPQMYSKLCTNALRPSSTHRPTLSISKRLTFSSTYVYQKDEWALPGNLYPPPILFFPLINSGSHFEVLPDTRLHPEQSS
ncbi:hypothetical protein L798_09131 [Zootermopsis nevadensis]|uniref:Uncharacterized protein n=1 Tax=Zootermopsis nevadensis TaxID=136037 RepID=A0A067QYJ4_ZOONE|nr:hypothetical protein L798_09131 [Zootermopsis nevadensis]